MTVPMAMLSSGEQVRLGAILPVRTTRAGAFVILELPDGRIKVIPSLEAVFDQNKRSAGFPDSVDYATQSMASINRMYMNHQLGCCVWSSAAHGDGIASGNDDTQGDQTPLLWGDPDIVTNYHGTCGPGDNGCVITDVLDARVKGVMSAGRVRKTDGYAAVDNTNKELVKAAIYSFPGGCPIGIDLPNDWTCTNCDWKITSSRVVGGHDVRCIDFDSAGVKVATWAGIAKISWEAFLSRRYIKEMYVELSPQMYGDDKIAGNGFDLVALKTLMKDIGEGKIPPFPGPIVPPPPPPPPPTTTVSVPFPEMTGYLLGMPLVTIRPTVLHGTIDQTHALMAGATLTIPPWLLPILKLACGMSSALPPPWNFIVTMVCGLLPANHEQLMASGQSVSITLPPIVITLIQWACSMAPNLPVPYNLIATGVCQLFFPQAKAPCGGCK